MAPGPLHTLVNTGHFRAQGLDPHSDPDPDPNPDSKVKLKQLQN